MNDQEIIELHRKSEAAKRLADARGRLPDVRKAALSARREADDARADVVHERQGHEEALVERARVRREAHQKPLDAAAREAVKVEERIRLATIRLDVAEERFAQLAGKAEALETEALALALLVRGYGVDVEAAARAALASYKVDRLARLGVVTADDVRTLRVLACGDEAPDGAASFRAVAEKLAQAHDDFLSQ
jgi:hypothetical protein